MKFRKISRYQHIAEMLKKDIRTSSEVLLPSADELCMRFRVSHMTIVRAIRTLASQGLIQTSAGKRAKIVRAGIGSSGDMAQDADDPAHVKLFRKIRTDIMNGTYRVGQQLPKIISLTLSERAGERTVSRALRMLHEQRLIHKEGRKWLIGPESARHSRSLADNSITVPKYFVVALWPDFEGWKKICCHTIGFNLYLPFFQSLVNELEKHFISVISFYSSAEEKDTSFPRGMERLFDYIMARKEHYLGVFFGHPPAPGPEWLSQFVRLDKPMVYSDLFDPQGPEIKSFLPIFCERNVNEAVRFVLAALASYGHRVIGILRFFDDLTHKPVGWVDARIKLLKDMAARHYPEMEIIVEDAHEEFWANPYTWCSEDNLFPSLFLERARQYLHGTSALGGAKINSLQDGFRECSPGLWRLVSHSGLTALIAANDRVARMQHVWLKQMGISVPRDLSLVGFDNDAYSHYQNMSSVDFGMDDCAYLAAHLYIQDIAVNVGKDRMLRGKARFINRGTVGPAKKG